MLDEKKKELKMLFWSCGFQPVASLMDPKEKKRRRRDVVEYEEVGGSSRGVRCSLMDCCSTLSCINLIFMASLWLVDIGS